MENNSKTVRGLGVATVQNGRSMFLQSFVKSRPSETRRSERVPLDTVSLKPAEGFLDQSMTETEGKNEITEANLAWNIHLTICSKMAFLNRDWSKLLPSLQTTVQPSLQRTFETQKHKKQIEILQSQITNHDLLNPLD